MSTAEQHKNIYKEEAYELLAELETSLLELEESPGSMEIIGSIFRALHTIKGSGSMFGFDAIARFTHEVETVFDMVRNGEVSVSKELIDLTLSSRDLIRTMLDDPEMGNSTDRKKAGEIIASLQKLVPNNKQKEEKCSPAPSLSGVGPNADEEKKPTTYRIRFRPPADSFTRGINPSLFVNELHDLGSCRIVAQKDALPSLNEICPEQCYIYWDIILTTVHDINAIKDIFIFVEDESELLIEIIQHVSEGNAELNHKKLGDILVERGDVSVEDLQKILRKQKRVGEMLVDAKIVDTGKVESALVEQQHIREMCESREVQQKNEPTSSIRVASDKLDRLVNLVGEMVTVQARLTQTTSLKNDPELILIAEEVERLTEELRDNTMSVRMVPIGTMFTRFKRLVRDLSLEMGKEIEMTTEGSETELDKTVIDKLHDPMVHLIRNSIDHGIETPDDRVTAGKPRQGTVHLSAVHSGANVLIEITDNGEGLNPEAIRAKAVERGMMEPDAELSEKDTFALILQPGFSTARTITNVSGRGVGMDVVKRSIESLRGTIEISSKRGVGTTITLKIPLTLAIIDGLLVKIGQELFVIPLSLVEECVELTGRDRENAHGRQMANVRGEIVPYINLRETFNIKEGKPEIEQIVITEVDDHRVGFVVDDVIGEHQTVIKTLGKFYKDVEGVSGATILGDGTVALILDAPRLIQSAVREEALINGNACIA